MGKTSWQVKKRYNDKVYSRISVQLPKELVANFKRKCIDIGVSQSAVIQSGIEQFLGKRK